MLAAYMWESNGFNLRDAKLFGFDQQGEKNRTSLTVTVDEFMLTFIFYNRVSFQRFHAENFLFVISPIYHNLIITMLQ